MNQLSSHESPPSQTWLALVASVAQATSYGELVRRAELALSGILRGGRYLLVWAEGSLAADRLDPATLEQLRAGASVRARAGRPGYIAIRCAGQLLGWVQAGAWSAEQAQALTVLAAVLGPATIGLRPQPPAEELAQGRLQAAIAQLRSTLKLDALLDQLDAVVQEIFGPISLLITLRHQSSSWVELAYLSIEGVPQARRAFWEQRAGLSGAVLQSEQPLFTDDYQAECARQGVLPLHVPGTGESWAWMGAPLSDDGQAFGVICLYSSDPELRFSPLQRSLFLSLAREVAQPIKGARLLRYAEQQARHMQGLNSITRAITSTLDPKRVPALIIELAQELFDAEEGSLLLRDDQTSELVFRYAGGPTGNQLIGQRLPSGVGVAGYVASSGQPAIVNNARSDGRFYDTPDGDTGFHTRSLLAVPLRGIDGVRGVIEILNRRDDVPFTEDDRALLEAIADQATIALENARHFAQIDQALARRAQELDRSNDRLHKILRASNALRAERRREDLLQAIANAVAESAGFRSVVVALTHRERTAEPYLQRVLAVGPAAAAFAGIGADRAPLRRLHALLRDEFRRSAATYLIDHRYSDYGDLWGGPEQADGPTIASPQAGGWHPRDALFSLLRDSRGDILGMLIVSDPDDGMQPSPDQVQILDICANQAAVAIENTQLYSDLQHNLNSMTALNGLGMAINTTLRSPKQIYELTVGGMVALIDAAWGLALLRDGPSQEFLLRPSAAIGPAPAGRAEVERLARAAIAQRRPQSAVVGDAYEASALIALPLRATGSVLGAICVGFAEGMPSPSDLESLGLFANQAAVAVESLQLFGAVRQGRDQLASIMASTREGMLLVSPDTRVAVANEAFRDLAELASWPDDGSWAPDLQDMAIDDLLLRWQLTAGYATSEIEQLHGGLTAVADGLERFVSGQLGPPRPGHRALEWSVLRATPEGREGAANRGVDDAPGRWPILLMLRDITAAKEADRLRQDLTSMMVHDLRSPLASIITSIDMIFRGTFGDTTQRQREILGIADTSAKQLLNLVNLLLDISRLESGQMPLNTAPCQLQELLGQAIERMAIISQKQGVPIVQEPPAVALAVLADGELVLRVLQNLLDNALKFSPRQSRVLVSVRRSDDGGYLRVAVRDSGPGIKPRDREKIFVKFGQADNRRGGGSGLGLTFCKLVVEAHGGTIGFESRLGEGSSFFFTLPVVAG